VADLKDKIGQTR